MMQSIQKNQNKSLKESGDNQSTFERKKSAVFSVFCYKHTNYPIEFGCIEYNCEN